jgi:hypothetical protein
MTLATVPATATVTVTQTGKKVIALPLDRKRSSRPSKGQACMSLVLLLIQIMSEKMACMSVNTAENSYILAANCPFAKTII